MPPELMLAHLVAFRTVAGRPNGALIDFVRDYLIENGVPFSVIAGPEGDRFNLFASIGPVGVPGYILSGHVDVVPAGEPDWRADPFTLREEAGRLIGRGACDMKGFVAAVLSAVPDLARRELAAPIHIALSYDEEAGCLGVPHLIKRLPTLCAAPLGCIVGEPTGLVPVLRHKGKATIRVSAEGISGHSSRPDLGCNAIHRLIPVLTAARAQSAALESGAQDPHFAPPWSTLQVGTVSGGQAVNILPAAAQAMIEARAIAGVDPQGLLAPVIAAAGEGVTVELQSAYPALSLDEASPLAALAADISGHTPLAAVSFGTEAGLFQAAGVPSVVCGPGDIARAHKPEEYLTVDELHAARAMALRLGDRLAAA
ncbi:acetylornithine deacetylase [Rhodovulum visakhapatnamense]|uniref:Acetylornithine deacetylase n=1 Tax=Rhodovulum visakhapatnamense TaxID=364297 RepID=A0A4R8FJ00_9RHOB|nr:acetylornithine deacetylase [Rhodovulum visakhapatnamense]TDX26106.1 acetylornithine deacetylase [Rhodovulum visakhapatnamense]